MSIPAPEGFMGSSHALDNLKLLDVDGDPASAELLPGVVRASGAVHSGFHAIFPGPPRGDEGVEMPKHMEMDFDDDENTDPFGTLRAAMSEASVGGQDQAENDFDDKTIVAPKPKFDPEETLDELPVGLEELGEQDEVEPETERNPDKKGTPDNDHNKPTWPKMPAALPVAPSGLGSVDQGTDAFRDAVVKALTTDPDGEFALVDDDEIEVV